MLVPLLLGHFTFHLLEWSGVVLSKNKRGSGKSRCFIEKAVLKSASYFNVKKDEWDILFWASRIFHLKFSGNTGSLEMELFSMVFNFAYTEILAQNFELFDYS